MILESIVINPLDPFLRICPFCGREFYADHMSRKFCPEFEGKLNDNNKIIGLFVQRGQKFPLDFSREKIEKVKIKSSIKEEEFELLFDYATENKHNALIIDQTSKQNIFKLNWDVALKINNM